MTVGVPVTGSRMIGLAGWVTVTVVWTVMGPPRAGTGQARIARLFIPMHISTSLLKSKPTCSLRQRAPLIASIVLCFALALLSMTLSKSSTSNISEMLSGYWVFVPSGDEAVVEAPVGSSSHIYDEYRSNGKWVWNDYDGEARGQTFGPGFHIRPAPPAPLARGRTFPSAITPPTPTVDDDDDKYLYDSWTGGWRTSN